MRFLFINSLSTDYVEDLLFDGLTEILGKENVISYPVNRKYYFSTACYPKNIGKCRSVFDYLEDLSAIKKKIQNKAFDAIIIGSTKEDAFKYYLNLIDDLPKGMPVIYVDGGDWPEIGGDAKREHFEELFNKAASFKPFNLIFKREYIKDKDYAKNVFPFPMSFKSIHNLKMVAKKYNVTFWAVESHEIRIKAMRLLMDKYDCNDNGTILGQKFKRYKRKGLAYLSELSASKIALNFRGVGWDTLRYWEIPGMKTFMITGHPKIVIPNNFVDREHVVYCKDDLGDLIPLIDYYLQNEKERETIAKNAQKHLSKYHTHIQRAEYFMEIVRQFLK
ncbi:MAG: glycosyltransferase [Candidatus Desantisbacteria bacterium]